MIVVTKFASKYWREIIIILITILAWSCFYNHPIDHESFLYYYYQEKPYNENWLQYNYFFIGYENNLARWLFILLIYLAKDYIWLQVIPFYLFIILVHLSFFLLVKKLTNVKIAFIAAILFSTNVAGAFEMYNHSRYFFERVPQFFIVFTSFFFWYKFLSISKLKDYLIGLVLFVASVVLAHFSVLFLPAFILLALFFKLELKKSIKNVIFTLPLIVISIILIRQSPLGPAFVRSGGGVFSIINDPGWVDQYLLQIVSMTQPKFIFLLFYKNIWQIAPVDAAMRLVLPTFAFYIFTAIFLFNKMKKYRFLILTSLAFVISFPVINIYLNRVNFQNELDGSRYFWLPHIFVFLYWALLLYAIGIINSTFRVLILLFTLFWVVTNVTWIFRLEYETRWSYQAIVQTQSYLKGIMNSLGCIKYIGIPPHVQVGPLSFFDIYYIHGRAKMIPSEEIINSIDDYNPDEVLILGYDRPFNSGDPSKLKVVPITHNSISALKKDGTLNETIVNQIIFNMD